MPYRGPLKGFDRVYSVVSMNRLKQMKLFLKIV